MKLNKVSECEPFIQMVKCESTDGLGKCKECDYRDEDDCIKALMANVEAQVFALEEAYDNLKADCKVKRALENYRENIALKKMVGHMEYLACTPCTINKIWVECAIRLLRKLEVQPHYVLFKDDGSVIEFEWQHLDTNTGDGHNLRIQFYEPQLTPDDFPMCSMCVKDDIIDETFEMVNMFDYEYGEIFDDELINETVQSFYEICEEAANEH